METVEEELVLFDLCHDPLADEAIVGADLSTENLDGTPSDRQ